MDNAQGSSLQARLRARLERAPDGRALRFVGSVPEQPWRTFGELYEAAARRGSVLASHGLARSQVCVLVQNSDEFCAETILACLLMGALPILVAPPAVGGLHSNLRQVLEHVVRKTGARLVVFGAEGEPLASQLAERSRKIRVLVGPQSCSGGHAAATRRAFPADGDAAALQLTSGTTGFPRVCVWEQRAILAALDGMERAMALGEEDVCVNWTPLYHDMGLVNNFLLCLVKGVPLVMLDTYDFVRRPSLWLRTLALAGGTITWSPNFGYAITAQRVRDSELEGVRLDRVRQFWNAAERVHLETMLGFHRRFAPYGLALSALKTNFGCAENIGGATFSDVDGTFPVEHVDRRKLYDKGIAVPAGSYRKGDGAVSVVGVGRPCPGITVRIRSAKGGLLPDGHVGEIVLDTPSCMKGYLGDARATARAVGGGALRTGDFGFLRGQELFWVGRVKERINLHGSKFDPSDFESVLLHIEGLREGCFAAFGVDDARAGTQRLIVVAEIRDASRRPHNEVLLEVREKVAQEVGVAVGEVLLVKQGTMSKTSSGKRRHKFYRDLYLRDGLEPVARLGAPSELAAAADASRSKPSIASTSRPGQSGGCQR